jgi:hypothetical protein
LDTMEVATPKVPVSRISYVVGSLHVENLLPPPPLRAQNKSLLTSSVPVTNLPSGVTTSIARTLEVR